MRLCDTHQLVAQVDLEQMGLWSLCDTDDERMTLAIIDSTCTGLTFDNFNPYAETVSTLFHAVMDLFGSEAIELTLTEDLGYEYCPVCFLDHHCPSRCASHDKLIHAITAQQQRRWIELSNKIS